MRLNFLILSTNHSAYGLMLISPKSKNSTEIRSYNGNSNGNQNFSIGHLVILEDIFSKDICEYTGNDKTIPISGKQVPLQGRITHTKTSQYTILMPVLLPFHVNTQADINPYGKYSKD